MLVRKMPLYNDIALRCRRFADVPLRRAAVAFLPPSANRE